jgi:transposase InsO family protein
MGKKKTKAAKLVDAIYHNPAAPGGYSGEAAVLREAKKKNKRIKSVKRLLEDKSTHTLHKPARKRFRRRKVLVANIGQQYQADLADMQRLSAQNDGHRYILTVIDCFSRKGFAQPLKDKTGLSVVAALKKVFAEHRPAKLQTDKGREFYNVHVKTYLLEQGVKLFSTEDDVTKAAMVERFNRTLKTKLWRYFHHKKTQRWIDVLPKFVKGYNASHHRTIEMAPDEVNNSNKHLIRQLLFADDDPPPETKAAAFKVGDYVRLSKHATVFDKGYTANWQLEVCKITEVLRTDPRVYRVMDLAGEKIMGTFYHEELQKVTSLPKAYEIEDVLETKGKLLKVKWKGYPAKFNSWILKSSMR